MKGGSKGYALRSIRQVSFKNMIGKRTPQSLNIQTGFDGNTKKLVLSTYRLVCSNGMKASLSSPQALRTPGNVGA
jgi:hypothetical protein